MIKRQGSETTKIFEIAKSSSESTVAQSHQLPLIKSAFINLSAETQSLIKLYLGGFSLVPSIASVFCFVFFLLQPYSISVTL